MTFEESWPAADNTCFERLKLAIGSGDKVGKGYLGYLPEGAANAWMFTSGTSAETDIGRLMGNTPLLCSLRFNALWLGRYVKDEDAKKASMRVYQFLNDTNNLHEIGNVQWLMLKGAPSSPLLETLENGTEMWVVQIPLEMVFATETTYDE